MIVNGEFGIYKGVEYELNEDMNGNLLIITSLKEKTDSTFVDRYGTGVYSKVVKKEELEEIYGLKSICTCNGITVSVREEDNDSFLIGVKDRDIADKLKLERTDKYFYEGKIPKKLLEIRTEKYPLNL